MVNDLRETGVVGLAGLDHLGRAGDVHWRAGPTASEPTLYRAEYRYDISGNRTAARVTQAAEGAVAAFNARSQVHSYNLLDQLTGSTVGEVALGNLTGTTPHTVNPSTVRRSDAWNLDVLGNWNAGNEADQSIPPVQFPGRTTQISLDTYGQGPSTRTYTDRTDSQNRLVSRAVGTGSQSPATPTHHGFDAAGNLSCDGTYFYQYDAWNRLIQVNRATQEPVDPPVLASDGITLVGYIWSPGGPLLKHYTYDGLGRLIRTQSPYPNPESPAGLRSERFYYDGIRRIQEVIADPVIPMEDVPDTQDQGLIEAAGAAQQSSAQPLDGEATPQNVESTQDDGGSGGGLEPVLHLDREYVWGPGDRGIDELLVQYDRQRTPWWVIQDDGGDVVALCDTGGTGPGGPNTAGRVVAQWTWDAYGECLSAATLVWGHPTIRCGHKGLFVDSLNSAVAASGGEEVPRIGPFNTLLCHNRNRTYMPGFGRFAQADPNSSAVLLLKHSDYHGRVSSVDGTQLSIKDRYADGLSLYAYLASAPCTNSDPLGLYLGATDTLYLGFEIGRVAHDLIDQYAGDLLAMTNWALDWKVRDDLFDEQEQDVDEHDSVPKLFGHASLAHRIDAATLVRLGRLGNAALKLKNGTVFASYTAAKAAIQASGRKVIAHHILECRHLKNTFRMSTNGPAVVLTRKQHKYVTRALRHALPWPPKRPYTKEYIWKKYQEVYADFPDWLRAIEHYFR